MCQQLPIWHSQYQALPLSNHLPSQQAYVVGTLYYPLFDETLKYYPTTHFINKVSETKEENE